MAQSGLSESVRTRKVLAFLGLAFGISWTGAIVFALTDVELGSLRGTVLEGLPVPPVVFLVGQGLVAGLTIDAVAALGEELGWRGLLLRELSPLGFWRLSLMTGGVWGVWHVPLIVRGHNFPEAPVGIAGIGAGLLATATRVVHDRYVADDRMTTGAPLVPWSR